MGMDWGAPSCGYCLKASMTGTLLRAVDSRLRGTSLRHGHIQQVLSVAFPVLTSGLRVKSAMTGCGNDMDGVFYWDR